jgi:tripartite-type tricarboxylate transporter receptor subunit TctC
MRLVLTAAALAVFAALTVAPASTQEWPTRPVTMVVPFAAGGPTDVLGRILDYRLSEFLGRQVIIENTGGAGGIMGSIHVAKAAPNGYQFVIGSQRTHAQNQALYKKPPYHPVADFAPVGLIVVTPLVLIARKDLAATDFEAFVAYFKENHSKMQFGSGGPGSGTHLGCVLLNAALGANVTHVPYRGSALAMHDLQASRLDYMCDFVSTALPQITGKTVKAMAMLDRDRAPVLSDLPTAQEEGLTNFEASRGAGSLFPLRIAPPRVRRTIYLCRPQSFVLGFWTGFRGPPIHQAGLQQSAVRISRSDFRPRRDGGGGAPVHARTIRTGRGRRRNEAGGMEETLCHDQMPSNKWALPSGSRVTSISPSHSLSRKKNRLEVEPAEIAAPAAAALSSPLTCRSTTWRCAKGLQIEPWRLLKDE